MGKGCITATKYFLFLFNLLFFIFGALIMGFGLWVLLDNQSFIAVLPLDLDWTQPLSLCVRQPQGPAPATASEESSTTLKVGSYILIGVGSLSILMGFLGCVGAVYEIRCLLGLVSPAPHSQSPAPFPGSPAPCSESHPLPGLKYFTCLLLILIAQVTAAVLIYFQRELLKNEMSTIVNRIIVDYTGENRTTELAWDYIQRTVLYPCSCRNSSLPGVEVKDSGLCEALLPDWPVYTTGCVSSVESWLLNNSGVILGICIAVAVIELLGMILSMCLCKSIQQEDYTKVPKY
ncbi:hypothetical protein JZ751_008165 [Albula glossodonta]|uniref:Tetraspanin n=1 Tax=Albula glossodonta TaxID=121402 RepID=A0A8T2N1X0_9TELE|nr:hypothetical protein JZ751_008165 [Albula glossodonta]